MIRAGYGPISTGGHGCPEHCPDHDYVYGRYDGHYCNNCGEHPPPDWFADRFD